MLWTGDRRVLVVTMVTGDADNSGLDSKETQSTRGNVCLTELAKRKAKGIKEVVEFNVRGQPIGRVAAEMQSYIGLLARQEVKISYKTWKMVPKEVKDIIWEHVNVAYVVQKTWRAGCEESAGTKWRQWKSKLYKKYILPNIDNPRKLNDPPPCSGILREDWTEFVLSRVTEGFKKWSEEQTKRVKKNIYPHRLSRRGYAGLAETMKDELCGEDDVDRAVMWKKARIPKKCDIEDDKLKQTVQRIDDCIRLKEEGELKTNTLGEDLLTCALQKRERPGHVRGVGSYVTPTTFFKKSKEHRQGKLKGGDKKIGEQQEMMICHLHDRVKKLEAELQNLKDQKDYEEKGSCSIKQVNFEVDEDLKDKVKENEKEDDCQVILIEKVDTLQGVFSAKKTKVRQRVFKERNVKCFDTLHSSMKVLYLHVEKTLTDGKGILIPFEDEIFGKPFEIFVHLEDIIQFCDLEPIPGNCVVVYMCHLFQEFKESTTTLGRLRFVNPFEISYVPKGDQDARTRALADRFEGVSQNQLVIVPCNVGEHWILTVVDPHGETIYLLDPLSHRIRDDNWKYIVNTIQVWLVTGMVHLN